LAELRQLGGNLALGRQAGLRTPRWRQHLVQALRGLAGPDGRLPAELLEQRVADARQRLSAVRTRWQYLLGSLDEPLIESASRLASVGLEEAAAMALERGQRDPSQRLFHLLMCQFLQHLVLLVLQGGF
jgi:hypothetical protein